MQNIVEFLDEMRNSSALAFINVDPECGYYFFVIK